MSEEITVEKLRETMVREGLKQHEVAEILDITTQQMSKIMNSSRKITVAEQKLLKLYFFGEFPFKASRPALSSVLNFTEEEWRLMETLSRRRGEISVRQFILATIRSYLAFDADAIELRSELSTPQKNVC